MDPLNIHADGFDDSRAVMAEHQGRQPFDIAPKLAEETVGRVNARCRKSDENIMRTSGPLQVELLLLQDLRGAFRRGDDSADLHSSPRRLAQLPDVPDHDDGKAGKDRTSQDHR